jgi:hypothetical protein
MHEQYQNHEGMTLEAMRKDIKIIKNDDELFDLGEKDTNKVLS